MYLAGLVLQKWLQNGLGGKFTQLKVSRVQGARTRMGLTLVAFAHPSENGMPCKAGQRPSRSFSKAPEISALFFYIKGQGEPCISSYTQFLGGHCCLCDILHYLFSTPLQPSRQTTNKIFICTHEVRPVYQRSTTMRL